MRELVDYIRAGARAPSVVLPCAPWACDWIRARTGVDPIADMRDDWTLCALLRRIKGEGGFEAMVRSRLAWLAETAAPEPGDVGLVEGGFGTTLAVRFGDTWVGKPAKRGISMGRFPMIAAWTVPCLR